MPSEKRQRQDEGRLARLEQQKMASRRSQRYRQVRSLLILLGALLIVALLVSVLSGDDGDDTDDVAAADTTTTTATDGTAATIEVPLPDSGESITGETPCPEEDGSSERVTSFEQSPPTCIDDDATYTATIDTTEGEVVIELDHAAAPVTVNNFVVLARYHYYDGVAFHRIIPGFMNQAGDPVGPVPGQGSPGYNIPDELPTGDSPYPAGTLAMANTGQADSGGAQFFIVVDGGGERLTPTYTVFGRVVEGQDVVDEINQHGDEATNGTPTKLVTIESVTISES